MKKITSLFIAIAMCLSMTATAFAAESAEEITMDFSEQGKIQIDLPETMDVDFLDYNVVEITDTETGLVEVLPTQTVDMEGNVLLLSYVKTSEGLDVYASSMLRWGWWDGVKCVAGTLGSVGTGFLAGTAVGTITVPGLGALSGLLVGTVSGGLVGIASFC